MSSVFDLIARLIEGLFVWLPRPDLVPQFEVMIRWTLERDPVVKTGLVWIIPLIHRWEKVDLRRYAFEFEPKVLWTKDGKEVAIGMLVLWRVEDPLTFCKSLDDPEQIVSRMGEAVLPELVGAFALEDLKRKAAGGEGRQWGFDTHLLKALASAFAPYGIVVEKARLNFTSDKVRTLKIITSS